MPADPPPHLNPDRLPCGLVLLRGAGDVLDANQTFGHILGCEVSVLVGQPFERWLTGAARVLFHTWLFPLLSLHDPIEEIELTLRREDGEEVDVLIGAAREDGGDEPRIRLSVMRVRARRWLEDQLLSARRAADQVPGVIFQLQVDPTGLFQFTYVSEGAWQFLGVGPAALIADASALGAAMTTEERERIAVMLRGSAASLTSWRHEIRMRIHGRERWLEASGTPRRLPDGAVVWSGYVADVTERLALEAVTREKESAEKASVAKSQFLARMSHELRNPLNAVLGLSRILSLRTAGRSEPEMRTALRHIQSAGQSLLRLVEEVLDISRIEAGNMDIRLVEVPMARIVDSALQLVEPTAEVHGISLSLATSSWVWVHTDEHRAVQALTNLLTNAVKYNRPGGRATVCVRCHADTVRVDVKDEGDGLTGAQIGALFRPYSRLPEHESTEGVGLGLVITRDLVERMGGRLEVKSQLGRGSCFSIVLPRADAPTFEDNEPASLTPTSLPASTLPQPDRLALYVEDDPVNVLIMQGIFESRPGWRLAAAENLRRGLDQARTLRPDLILTDMHFPDGDGYALLRQLQEEPALATVPVVAVSAAAMRDDLERAAAAGFTRYWTKPLDVDRTLEALDALFGDAGR